jgi:hypothetical protein
MLHVEGHEFCRTFFFCLVEYPNSPNSVCEGIEIVEEFYNLVDTIAWFL